jgi:hypothetical protein
VPPACPELNAVRCAFATVAMIWWKRHSDVTNERLWHVVCPAVVSGLALIASAYLGNPILAAIAVSNGAMGTFAVLPGAMRIMQGSRASMGRRVTIHLRTTKLPSCIY